MTTIIAFIILSVFTTGLTTFIRKKFAEKKYIFLVDYVLMFLAIAIIAQHLKTESWTVISLMFILILTGLWLTLRLVTYFLNKIFTFKRIQE